jgi:hypothetical protein
VAVAVVDAAVGLDLGEVLDGEGGWVAEEVGGFGGVGEEFADLEAAVDDAAGAGGAEDPDQWDQVA